MNDEILDQDDAAMRLALIQAEQAARIGEVPVGAIIIDADGRVIGRGYNQTISGNDPSAHAEIVALRAAGARLKNYRLPGTTLFVTLEPCMMCVGAIMHARVPRVVYGAKDPKTGACGSVLRLQDVGQLNHHTVVEGGVLADECSEILRAFFRERRHEQKRRAPSESGHRHGARLC